MIELKDVSFSYPGGPPLFEHLSASFPDRGLVVLLGRSGSGKTTLLSLLNGTLTPDSGTIHNPLGAPALCFQSPLLLDYLTAGENVSLPLWLGGKECEEERLLSAFEEVGLPEGRERDVSTLSGGEKIRVSLARALIQKRPFLLLDEPTGGLDEENAEKVFRLLRSLSRDRLLLVVTHGEKEARKVADAVYLLKDGKLLREGGEKAEERTPLPSLPEEGSLTLGRSLFLSGRYLRGQKGKFLFSVFFLVLTLVLLATGFNVYRNLPSSLPSFFSSSYAARTVSLYRKEKVAAEGSLALERKSLPSAEDRERLGIPRYYPSLSYFLPESHSLVLGEVEQDVRMTPVLFPDPERVRVGRVAEKEDEAVVNTAFLAAFGLSTSVLPEERIAFSKTVLLFRDDFSSRDLVEIPFSFRVVGIAKESGAFQEPACYPSYFPLLDRLSKVEAPGLSEEAGTKVTAKDVLEVSLSFGNDLSGRKVLLYEDPFRMKERIEALEDPGLFVENAALEKEKSTKELVVSLSQVFGLFLVLSLFTSVLLEGMSVYSLDLGNLRLFAYAKAQTRSKRSFLRIALGTAGLYFLVSSALFLLLYGMLSFLLPFLFSSFSFPPFFSPLDVLPSLLALLLLLSVSLFSSALPLRRIREEKLSQELSAED